MDDEFISKKDFLKKAELHRLDKAEIYKRLAYQYKILARELGLYEPDAKIVEKIENEICDLEEAVYYEDFYKHCNSCSKPQLHRKLSDDESECLNCSEGHVPLIELNSENL
jgi:hypothetical protein